MTATVIRSPPERVLPLNQEGLTLYSSPAYGRSNTLSVTRLTTDNDRDRLLIERIAGGDNAALAELYDQYSGLMYATGCRILSDRREAEDLLHDVFIELWRKAGTYEASRGTVRTWLLMRLRSRALDRCKSARVSRSVALEDTTVLQNRAAPTTAPEKVPDRAVIRAAVMGLPDRQRTVLELAYFKGFSSSEIARALDLPIGTVKSRVAAGMARLRLLLCGGQS